MFFGIAISKQAKERREPIINGVNCIVDAMVWMINKVMIIAPIGVFGLMAEAVGTFGFGALMVVFKLFVVYVAAILVLALSYTLQWCMFSRRHQRRNSCLQ